MGLKIDGTVVMAGSVVANTDPDKVDENMRALEEIASWCEIGPPLLATSLK